MKIYESKKIEGHLDLARELKKNLWNMRVTVMPIVVNALRVLFKGLKKKKKKTGGARNLKKYRDHPDNRIVKIG